MHGPSSQKLEGPFILRCLGRRGTALKRTIIQIDGGHVRAIATNAGHDFNPDFIEAFASSLSREDEDVLRVLYYDCAPYQGSKPRPVSGSIQNFSKSDGWLRDLSGRDLFAVRLGILKWRGWLPKSIIAKGSNVSDQDFKPEFEQKGVDLRIGLDIATYALDGLVDRIILVTGDTDLIPAMKLARRKGVQIVGIDFPGTKPNSELRAHVDISRAVGWPAMKP